MMSAERDVFDFESPTIFTREELSRMSQREAIVLMAFALCGPEWAQAVALMPDEEFSVEMIDASDESDD